MASKTNFKRKLDKLDFIKIENFYVSNYTIKKVKTKSIACEKIIANQVSNLGLVSRIYKYLLKLNNITTNYPTIKWAKNFNSAPKKMYE